MNLIELFLVAVGLSADAFAVSVGLGLTITSAIGKKALLVGLYFGAFQAGMPIIGYLAAMRFAQQVDAYAHFVAFALLCFLGVKMLIDGLKKQKDKQEEASLAPLYMIPLAFATSIDALAVGVSFAFLRVDILLAAPFIGVTTFILSAVGVKIGNVFGVKYQSKAVIAGGVILILIGLRILFN